MTVKIKIATAFLVFINLIIVLIFVTFLTEKNIYFEKEFITFLATMKSSNCCGKNKVQGKSEGWQITNTTLNQNLKNKINFQNDCRQISERIDEVKLDILIYHRSLKPWPEGIAPYARGKVIEIDLSKQHLRVWEKGNLLHDWLTSTGKAKTPTKTGIFSVISKEEWAYGTDRETGAKWAMPKWLGVYRAGSIENGIHALPYIDGWKEGSGSLGRAISHGCIRLADTNAQWLFNWADLGTPVIIHH